MSNNDDVPLPGKNRQKTKGNTNSPKGILDLVDIAQDSNQKKTKGRKATKAGKDKTNKENPKKRESQKNERAISSRSSTSLEKPDNYISALSKFFTKWTKHNDLKSKKKKEKKAINKNKFLGFLKKDESIPPSITSEIQKTKESSESIDNDFVFKLLDGRMVSEIMVPRIDMKAAPRDKVFSYYVKMAIDTGISRIPIFNKDEDEILGLLYVKDLLRFFNRNRKNFDVTQILREAYIVPESMGLDELLKNFLIRKNHLAIVVDEYGGVSGIVTLEDVIEEIVGEIHDEYDHEEVWIKKMPDGSYKIDGRIALESLQKITNVKFPVEEFDTLSGFLYHLLGKVPEKNEIISYQEVDFKIVTMQGNRIKKVQANFIENGDTQG